MASCCLEFSSLFHTDQRRLRPHFGGACDDVDCSSLSLGLELAAAVSVLVMAVLVTLVMILPGE